MKLKSVKSFEVLSFVDNPIYNQEGEISNPLSLKGL